MKSVKQSVQAMALLFAAVVVLSISMAAQQEVSPDHFDDNPVVVKKSKQAPAASKRVAAKKPSPSSHAVLKPKAAPEQHASAKNDAAPVQTASNRQ
jgi:hypothetical protein